MSSTDLKRKLAAIPSADVKGYRRLMGEDEEWTVRTLNAHKGVIRNLVGQHRGRRAVISRAVARTRVFWYIEQVTLSP